MERTPQNIRREQTKQKILSAAKDLFSKSDYFQTNSKDIAKAAGVSIGSFYTYFENKREVMIEILHAYRNETLPPSCEQDPSNFTSASDATQSLTMIIRSCFAMHNFPLGFYKNITILSILDEEIGAIFQTYEQDIILKIKELLLKQHPTLPPVQLEAAGIVFYSAVKGSIHHIQFQNSTIEESCLIEELIFVLKSYLNSLNEL